MSRVSLMSDISNPAPIPGAYREMLNKLSDHFKYHVSQYNRFTNHFVLWHEEGCRHEYTWLTTERLDDMLMAIEYLYHHKVGGKQIAWKPQGYWLDNGFKALAGIK